MRTAFFKFRPPTSSLSASFDDPRTVSLRRTSQRRVFHGHWGGQNSVWVLKSASCAPKIGATSRRGVLAVLQTFPSVWHNVRFHAIRVQTVSSTDPLLVSSSVCGGGWVRHIMYFGHSGPHSSFSPSIDNLFETENHEKCAGARKVAHFLSNKVVNGRRKTRKVRRKPREVHHLVARTGVLFGFLAALRGFPPSVDDLIGRKVCTFSAPHGFFGFSRFK
jgi:hypothetical protein